MLAVEGRGEMPFVENGRPIGKDEIDEALGDLGRAHTSDSVAPRRRIRVWRGRSFS